MDNSLKLTALEQKQLESLLKQAGSRTISAETLAAAFAEGAPRNADGTICNFFIPIFQLFLPVNLIETYKLNQCNNKSSHLQIKRFITKFFLKLQTKL